MPVGTGGLKEERRSEQCNSGRDETVAHVIVECERYEAEIG